MNDMTPVAQEETIAMMTRAELMDIVNEIVENKLRRRSWPGQRTDRSVAEILESMQRNIWTPPPARNPVLKCCARIVTHERIYR